MQANKIIEEVCEYFDISDEDIRGKSRQQMYLVPRYIAILLIRNQGYSLVDIGKMFYRDHSTIINALNKIDANLQWVKLAEKVNNKINRVEPCKVRLKNLLLDNGLSRGQADLITKEITKIFNLNEK